MGVSWTIQQPFDSKKVPLFWCTNGVNTEKTIENECFWPKILKHGVFNPFFPKMDFFWPLAKKTSESFFFTLWLGPKSSIDGGRLFWSGGGGRPPSPHLAMYDCKLALRFIFQRNKKKIFSSRKFKITFFSLLMDKIIHSFKSII